MADAFRCDMCGASIPEKKPAMVRSLFFGVLAGLLIAQTYAIAAPAYEQIAAFRPTPTTPGASLFHHSDESFYGMDFDSIYRITPAGELTAFAPIRGVGTVTFDAADFVETSDGRLWAALNYTSSTPRSVVVRFDPEREKLKIIAGLPLPLIPNSGLTDDGLGFLWGASRCIATATSSDGNLYGSTTGGGILEAGKPAGGGVFYRIRFGPTPVTLPAAEITATSAILHGTINPHGAFTRVTFDIGLDPELKTFWTVPAGKLGARTRPRPVEALIENLDAGTVYYFRVNGESSENEHPQHGAVLSLQTQS